MEYRFLGKTGLRVSVISLGAWITYGAQVQDEQVALDCMTAAFEAGVNFFDNAEVYGAGNAETVMGNVLKKAGWKRSDYVISTKVFWGGKGPNDIGLSRKHIIEGVQASLKRLQLDYVDIVFCHRADLNTPMEETVRAMNWVIEKGWAFYWGTSEWSAEQISHAIGVANRLNLIPPVAEQPQYSMLHRTRFEFEFANLYKSDNGLGTTIWSPLACGLLSGKYSKDKIPEDSRLAASNGEWLKNQLLNGTGMNGLEEKNFDTILDKVEHLKPIAASVGATLAQLAIAWTIVNPNVSTCITGASRKEQVLENLKALEIAKKLTPEILDQIDKVLNNKHAPEINHRFR
jgi:voltage-dependent potassium channel beta subunit